MQGSSAHITGPNTTKISGASLIYTWEELSPHTLEKIKLFIKEEQQDKHKKKMVVWPRVLHFKSRVLESKGEIFKRVEFNRNNCHVAGPLP